MFPVKVWSGDSDSMYADKTDVVSLQMCYDAVWDDEVTCDQIYHSLCEKTCGDGDQVEEPPMECIAAQGPNSIEQFWLEIPFVLGLYRFRFQKNRNSDSLIVFGLFSGIDSGMA